MKSAFTLIEILVVATIISLLAAAGVTSFTQFNKNARDARRKTDVENIRAALEMYKSANDSYPSSLPDLVSSHYLKSNPQDPKPADAANPYYSYSPLPAACSPAGTPCSNYTLTSNLELGGAYTADPLGATVIVACTLPYGNCNNVCVNLQTDSNNCGSCNSSCPAGLTCVNYICNYGGSSCAGGFADCGGSCYDLQTDFNHCGGCETACTTGQTCSNGVCTGGQFADGHDCTNNTDCTNSICTSFYTDSDNDGYGASTATATKFCGTTKSGYATNNTDCYDSSANVHPGQTIYFTVQRGDGSYDYDCSGTTTKQYSVSGACQCISDGGGAMRICPYCNQVIGKLINQLDFSVYAVSNTCLIGTHCQFIGGWLGTIISCGQTGNYITGCGINPTCSSSSTPYVQGCR